MKAFSNLSLDGDAPIRVRPEIGEWGPERVILTRQKKRQRVWVGAAYVAAVTALFVVGYFFYLVLTGQLS